MHSSLTTDTPVEMLPLINERDEQIGVISRDDLIIGEHYFRASAAWITAPDGRILLAQRAHCKRSQPGCWGVAVAGTIADGEDPAEAMEREMWEELGLEGVRIAPGEVWMPTPQTPYATYWFSATIDPNTPLTLRDDEVAGVRWVTVSELWRECLSHPERFVAGFVRDLLRQAPAASVLA